MLPIKSVLTDQKNHRNQTNQINSKNQINQINQTDQFIASRQTKLNPGRNASLSCGGLPESGRDVGENLIAETSARP
jgi:hypothetical protein